ncbi:MAG: adenylate/guanylate cyclase domain-containing protein, partial [Cyclobacteriaceae bacterium]|nr:adenylate/guanylate cyclase domain-containing protein [Cyclobacteriaceae bacterium]
ASDAVRCAIEIQKQSKDQDLPLKIGIHEGEMVFEGNDVLGDGVNIASRIQDDTQEGCIMISGSVYKDIKNKSDIKTKFIKEKAFKNVDEPVKVYQVLCEGETKEDKSGQDQDQKKSGSRIMYYIVGGLVVVIAAILIWQFIPNKEAGKPTPEETVVEMDRSIAVLPFKNLSPEEENQYFCDGIMEGILNHLSKIKDLRVVSRTSVEKYRDGSIQSPQIGEELNVTYLVEASVFKLDDKIRVTAQLIESAKDEHIWSGEYDRDLKDVFEVMSDISQQVASEVKVVIAPEVKERIESIPTKNLDAYNYYLLGLHNSNQLTTDGFLSSIEYYEKALQLDPKFAHAYVGVALGYHNLVRYSFIRQEEG